MRGLLQRGCRASRALARTCGSLYQLHIGACARSGAEGAFDGVHVAKCLVAVDRVRRQEHWVLMKQGQEDLKGTKYGWLTNPANMPRK